jgi:hypothetical protein
LRGNAPSRTVNALQAEERGVMDEQGQSLKIVSFCDCVEQDVQHVLRGGRWVCENCGHAIPE